MRSLVVGNYKIGYGNPPFIIAEAGVNHNGRLDLALKLVDAASYVGADAVKFQTFKAEEVVTGVAEMAEYQKKNLGKSEPQAVMLRKLELPEKFYKPIIRRCREKKIMFMSTPHGHISSADFLKKLGMKIFKIGSGDLTNRPFLEHVARFKKPMIISTGMATLSEVKEAIGWIKNAGNKKLVVLHCTTSYPCLPEEVNLRAMQTMMRALPDVMVGYSDHTLGNLVPAMAATLGASVIEKHLTLDKTMKGPDHKVSSSPEEFKEMARAVRSVGIIMGGDVKRPNPNELKVLKVVRKSIVITAPIKRGEKFTKKSLGVKRPGIGIQPKYYFKVLGKRAKKDLRADTILTPEHYD